jgi:hypothetical protein
LRLVFEQQQKTKKQKTKNKKNSFIMLKRCTVVGLVAYV